MRVRVVSNGRTGVASTERPQPEAARGPPQRSAKEMADVAAADPLFPGLAPPADVAAVDRFFESTADGAPGGTGRRGRRLDRQMSGRIHCGRRLRDRCGRGRRGEHQRAVLLLAIDAGIAHHGDHRRRAAAAASPRRSRARSTRSTPRCRPRAADKALGQPATRRARRPVRTRWCSSRPRSPRWSGSWPTWGSVVADYLEGRSCFSGKEGERVAAEA